MIVRVKFLAKRRRSKNHRHSRNGAVFCGKNKIDTNVVMIKKHIVKSWILKNIHHTIYHFPYKHHKYSITKIHLQVHDSRIILNEYIYYYLLLTLKNHPFFSFPSFHNFFYTQDYLFHYHNHYNIFFFLFTTKSMHTIKFTFCN